MNDPTTEPNIAPTPATGEQTPEDVAAQAAKHAKAMLENSTSTSDPRVTDQLHDPADILFSLPLKDPSKGVEEKSEETKVELTPDVLMASDGKATDLNVGTLPPVPASEGVKQRGEDTEIPVLHTDVGLVALTGAKNPTPAATETVTPVMVSVPVQNPSFPSQEAPQSPAQSN